MSETYDVADNVNAFMVRAAADYARFKENEFHQSMWARCRFIESPIEQLFYVAMHVVSEINLVKLSVGKEFKYDSNELAMIHQWPIDSYRVDYALRQHNENKIVCVELDGHQFHDRDERQRRYEKRRDRFLSVNGFTVLHFTGAEVVKDAYAVALEAFIAATNLGEVAIHPKDE